MRQIILLFLGIAFLIFGVIGLHISVILQVPFFIAALLCICGCIPGLRKQQRGADIGGEVKHEGKRSYRSR